MVGEFIDTLPTWLLGVAVCGGAVAVTTVCQVALHRRWPVDSRKPLNEIAGFIIAVVGVVYAVLLASIAILAIERYDRAQSIVETEAGLVSDLYRDAVGMPQPARAELRATLTDYAATIVTKEWTEMEAGVSPRSGWQDPGWRELESFLGHLAAFEPKTTREQVFLQEMLGRTNSLIDARRSRMFVADNGISAVIWWVVVLGAVSTVGLALVFGIKNAPGHLLVSDVLALSIGLVLLLIIAMDRPFSGASRVTSAPFEYVQDRLAAIAEGP
jgi:hypothetical protein